MSETTPLRRSFGSGKIPHGVTDRIVLREDADETAAQIVHGWMGVWPPPAHLVRAVHRFDLTGEMVRVVNPNDQDADGRRALGQMRTHPNFVVVDYWLRSASQLPEAARPGDGWCRAAEYVRGTEHGPA